MSDLHGYIWQWKPETEEGKNHNRTVRGRFRKVGRIVLFSCTGFLLLLLAAVNAVFGEEQMEEIEGYLLGAVGNVEDTLTENSSESGDGEEEILAEQQEEEYLFVPILEADSTELTITWEGLSEEGLSEAEALKTEIQTAIDAFSAEGYSTGFLLYDINTEGGISYRADESYYSASTIKGPYVAWLVQAYPQTADSLYDTIENTIAWSSNDDYEMLISTYGSSEFDSWIAGLGCKNIALSGEWYPDINARDFAVLWNSVYDSFLSGSVPAYIQDFYTGTLESAIYETLGSWYTVYSKAGWIGEGLGTYYNVQNDAGIVMKGEDPYVIVVLSDAYGRTDLLDHLVAVLDSAHTSLLNIESTE